MKFGAGLEYDILGVMWGDIVKAFKCPNCGEETISLYKKAFLDIRSTYKCKKCGCSYGPGWYGGILAISTVLGAYYVWENIPDVAVKVPMCILIFILDIALNIFFVPVVKK